MKQYTTPEQTAKLIELGMPRPKGWEYPTMSNRYVMAVHIDKDPEFNYSIGELIEMLPESASQRWRYVATKRAWIVDVDMLGKQGKCHRGIYYAELIDALYGMIVKLKKEGVL